ncbi:uncharacterized protein DSM5745_08086 [Aspergillus mulundensis]|uniref:Phosphoribosyltransferase domain-containing protein n=1 Tax=Aspergillus mulundensis TaxID=1810919 RepID=A0A3D8R974_9EURO|nr:hypothetical protein DSM5745_08086 [Aspergillus mulundensis]RDW70575.1 hypothetical protein DSM5745_08086 [Aspergillus mulundensis]
MQSYRELEMFVIVGVLRTSIPDPHRPGTGIPSSKLLENHTHGTHASTYRPERTMTSDPNPNPNPQDASYTNRVTILPQGNYLLSLMTTIRDKSTSSKAFAAAFDRVSDLLIAAGTPRPPPNRTRHSRNTNRLDVRRKTPGQARLRREHPPRRRELRGCAAEGLWRQPKHGQTAHPTQRGNQPPGASVLEGPREHRVAEYAPPSPPPKSAPLTKRTAVLILEPMLATGGSASTAINVLKEKGVREEDIIFVNLVASRHGLETVMEAFPGLRLVTAAVDGDLTGSNHIAPGLGDFGDRFYGT